LNLTRIKNKNSAFSLIELSIVLIIMGLLVAGVTGGASMVENAKITSLKREVDDHIRDLFTFYSRTGRLPGDLNNNGKIGWDGSRNLYPAGSFSAPYNGINGINKVSASFIELYLYEISSFKPDPSKNGITANDSAGTTFVKNLAVNNAVPISKVYKDYSFMYRTEFSTDTGKELGVHAINMFLYAWTSGAISKKSVNIVKKLDLKFDDGVSNRGDIIGYCNIGFTTAYSSATVCSEALFYFGIK
jgi:prepilin-type N-terminal cleavage/methylation domain-containing protein